MNPKPIIFNFYPRPTASGKSTLVYDDDPVLRLDEVQSGEGKQFPRNAQQQAKLAASGITQLDRKDPVFGASLNWACRGYIVQRLSNSDNGDSQDIPGYDDVPEQAVSIKQRRAELKGLKLGHRKVTPLAGDPAQCQVDLYLFNILVALEWEPDERTMQQLKWAFRRASDFLYDVTDGCMAFGQVVFGGREWMECADILILASNRLHPRSWVAGMHLPEKYLPIRMGRGMWHRRHRFTIPWDEPESYRTLVHEWAHYAFGLRDEYLTLLKDQALVVPSSDMSSTSIMASLEGTSELVPHAETNSATNKSEEWERNDSFFPGLKHGLVVREGPGRLPLSLPRFHQIGTVAAKSGSPAIQSPPRLYPAQAPFSTPTEVQAEHCWVYLLRQGSNDAPHRLIAQGTLDARSQTDGFLLLGAMEKDAVILFHEKPGGWPEVLQGIIQAGAVQWSANTTRVEHRSSQGSFAVEVGASVREAQAPPQLPLISIVPYLPEVQLAGDHYRQAMISVQIQSHTEPPAGSAVWVFPLGQLDSQESISLGFPNGTNWLSDKQVVPTLDGHVLVRWGDQILINAFSQGGGPPFHTGQPANPITAGSSDGNVFLFFRDEGWKEGVGPSKIEYSQIKVTTTLLLGTSIAPPDDGQVPFYTYSLGGSATLPQELTPTMIMFYDPIITTNKGDLQVYRLNEDGKTWTGLETYHEPFSWFAAVPLNMTTASKLVDPDFAGPRVEYYRLGKSTKE